MAFSLLDPRSTDGNALAGLIGLDLSLSSSQEGARRRDQSRPRIPVAPVPPPGIGGGFTPADVTDLPEFFALPNPVLLNAGVTGDGGVDSEDNNELVSAEAAATVSTTVILGFMPPVTAIQQGTATTAIVAPTVPNSPAGINPISATFNLSNQQAVQGSFGTAGNTMNTYVNGGRTVNMDSTGPDSWTGLLVEDITFAAATPAPSPPGSGVVLVGGGGFSSNNFAASWFAGGVMRLTRVNMASTVIKNTPGEIKISTPVTLPVWNTPNPFTIAYTSNVQSMLNGQAGTTNGEHETMNYGTLRAQLKSPWPIRPEPSLGESNARLGLLSRPTAHDRTGRQTHAAEAIGRLDLF